MSSRLSFPEKQNPMRLYLSLFLCLPLLLHAQQNTLHTAANAAYMKPIEREMLHEINLLPGFTKAWE